VDVIAPTVVGISEEIGSIKFNENYQSAIRVIHVLFYLTQAMTLLVQNKLIAGVMPSIPNWIPSQPTSGAVIEHSLLGRFFSLSPLSNGVTETYFKSPKLMTPGDKLSMSNTVQEALRRYQDYLFKICDAIVRSGTEGRRGILDWFSAALEQNTKRKAMQVDLTTVASDGFMINLVAVLNKFSDPFIDIQATRVLHVLFPADNSSIKST
jgi:ubiquitin conjugation factor E4 B